MSAYKILAEKIIDLCPSIEENSLYLILDEFIIEKRDNGYENSTNEELLISYLATIELENLSPKTIKEYRSAIGKLLKDLNKPVVRITTNDIRMFMTKKSWKPATRATNLYAYRSFFNWLERERIILRSPAKDIKPPKKDKRMPKALNEVQQEQVKEACRGTRERALVEVFLASGMRISELISINIQDVHFDTKRILVIGKGNKERYVFLTDRAVYHLKKYLDARKDKEEALFVSEKGQPRRVTVRAIQNKLKTINNRMPEDAHLHPHRFRHTYATNLVNRGVPLPTLQKLMGHNTIDTTNVYIQTKVSQLQFAYDQSAA